MGKLKKSGEDTRGAKAKAQKAAARKAKEESQNKLKAAKVDAEWKVGANSRSQAKEKANQEKQEEKLRRALEKKAQLEAEESELSRMKKPKGKARKAQKAKSKKNDFSALNAFLEEEEKEKAKKAASKSRITDMQPLTKNTNKEKALEEANGIYNATGIENALEALNVASLGDSPVDKHPEKRAKAAYLAFETRRMQEIRKELPGLKRSQYKEKLWKEWQKSAENPFNQIEEKQK